jgi:hypothetical protein
MSMIQYNTKPPLKFPALQICEHNFEDFWDWQTEIVCHILGLRYLLDHPGAS